MNATTEPQPATGTAKDMIAMLRRHYVADETRPGGIFAPEIQAPGGNRRADLIWQGVTAGSGHELIGHEVKVTRADLLAELADPTKSDPWQKYCDRWYLVVLHPSLIEGLELPPTWGVLAPPSGRRTRSMSVITKAPQLKPANQAPAYLTLATWMHWRMTNTTTNRERDVAELQRLRATCEDLRLRTPAVHKNAAQLIVEDIVLKLGVYGGQQLGDWDTRIELDDVVTALRDLGVVKQRQHDAERAERHILQTLTDIQTQVQRVHERAKKAEVS